MSRPSYNVLRPVMRKVGQVNRHVLSTAPREHQSTLIVQSTQALKGNRVRDHVISRIVSIIRLDLGCFPFKCNDARAIFSDRSLLSYFYLVRRHRRALFFPLRCTSTHYYILMVLHRILVTLLLTSFYTRTTLRVVRRNHRKVFQSPCHMATLTVTLAR